MATSNVLGKGYLMSRLVKDTGIDAGTAVFVYDTLFNLMLKQGLEKGKDIILPGIGRICLVESRSFKSNMTGVMIPKHKRIKFKSNVRLAYKIRVDSREHPITIK